MEYSKSYYVALDSEVYGPYSLDELLDLGLLPDTLVCTSEAEADWHEAESYPELACLFNDDSCSDERIEPDEALRINQTIWRQKRKSALIGVLTLGLAGLSVIGVGTLWNSNVFAGTSFDEGGIGFVAKIMSFLLLSVILAAPFFIISVVRLIYYHIKLSSI